MIKFPSITDIHNGLLNKDFSATEIVKDSLKTVEDKDQDLNAFISVTKDLALNSAKRVDDAIANKQSFSPNKQSFSPNNQEIPVLAGVPIGIKDIYSTLDIKTTAGSKILANYNGLYDATVVQKLKDAMLSPIGKLNMDEFAQGSSGEFSAFGATKNPWDLSRTPGGSSSGSAAAVASGECVVSIGSDTGGSIRLPASFCNTVGLKPTYGRVSRYGVIAMASSLDCPSPMARSVQDVSYLLQAIAGPDKNDATSSPLEVPDYSKALTKDVKGLKIGLPKEYFAKGLDPKVEILVKNAVQTLAKAGAEVLEISLPHTEQALATYYVIVPAEISSNMARYDGIRFGLSEQGNSLIDGYFKTRDAGFGEEVKRRIMIGTYVLSAGYYDAYYLKAQKVRTLIKQDFDHAFEKVDVIASPVSPTLPFKIGEKVDDPLTMYLSDVLTVPINLAGVPAMSIPCGFADGLPVGMQLVAKHFDEETLLTVGHQFQQLTDFHTKHPDGGSGEAEKAWG